MAIRFSFKKNENRESVTGPSSAFGGPAQASADPGSGPEGEHPFGQFYHPSLRGSTGTACSIGLLPQKQSNVGMGNSCGMEGPFRAVARGLRMPRNVAQRAAEYATSPHVTICRDSSQKRRIVRNSDACLQSRREAIRTPSARACFPRLKTPVIFLK